MRVLFSPLLDTEAVFVAVARVPRGKVRLSLGVGPKGKVAHVVMTPGEAAQVADALRAAVAEATGSDGTVAGSDVSAEPVPTSSRLGTVVLPGRRS